MTMINIEGVEPRFLTHKLEFPHPGFLEAHIYCTVEAVLNFGKRPCVPSWETRNFQFCINPCTGKWHMHRYKDHTGLVCIGPH